MRKMLTPEQIDYNSECFRRQMERFLDFNEKDGAILARNGDWLCKLNYIQMLREVGVHFSVNRMLTAECFKSRMERGLSFLEFNYMIMQSYDFLKLYQTYGCTMQMLSLIHISWWGTMGRPIRASLTWPCSPMCRTW